MVLENSCTDGVSNTRPERTQGSALRVLVDWVQCTFQLDGTFEEIKHHLGLSKLAFQYLDYGRDTFTEQIKFGHITIMRKGTQTYRLVLTGQGCREYESLSDINWLQLFEFLKGCLGCDFRRVDIAIDDFEKMYDVNRIRLCVKKGLVVTRLQEFTDHTKGNILTGELTMDSYYLGSMDSRVSINFYDKKLERENNKHGQELEVTVESWTRTEVRCKKEYSNQLIDMIILNEMDLGVVVFGTLKKNVRFIKNHKDINNPNFNKRRQPMAMWWEKFIGDVEKLKFSLQAPDRTIEKIKEWHFKSVAPSIAAVAKSFPSMIEFYNYIEELVENGTDRLTQSHEMMIEQDKELRYREVTNKKARNDWNSESKLMDNDEEINYNEITLNKLYEFTGKDKNRKMKKTYTCNRIGIVKPYQIN